MALIPFVGVDADALIFPCLPGVSEGKDVKDNITKDDGLIVSRQKILIFQQNGSGEQKIAGVKKYGEDQFELEVFSIDEVLPPVLDDTSDYIPSEISCDLVLDFLKHQDLSHDLAALCAEKKIPIISSGKKIINKWAKTPPT